jgi:alkanesulfonate monooxygenase SsuD/methylene tetrahydromethanopterin reductase-like flavin-dependent oxidoreductase (luciferase family)
MIDFYRPWLEEGFRRAGPAKSFDGFEIQPGVSVVVTDDVQGALDRMKPGIALYAGGMGHRDKNFHNDMMIRRGYPEAAAEIQELYLAGRKQEAIAAVPDDYCDEQALVGPPQRIRDRYSAWATSGATGLILSCRRVDGLELMAELTGSRDRSGDE